MTAAGPYDGQARTPVLDLPVRSPSTEHPYWHRPDPLVAVTHLDPGYATLRGLFPAGWTHLVRASARIDVATALESPRLADDPAPPIDISPLLSEAAAELLRFAKAEHGSTVAAQAVAASERLEHYARTREWKPIELCEPDRGQPWLFCGPLSTWAMRPTRSQLTFLVVAPNLGMQAEVDAVDARLPELKSVVSQVLGGHVKSVKKTYPAMRATELLLVGGDPKTGHKSFAHFFPLEAYNSSVAGVEFTVVLENVYATRFKQCSMRLIDHVQGEPGERDIDDVTRSSLRWFRCHDLGHFWRLSAVSDAGSAVPELTAFELMMLEEAYADVLGLLCAEIVCAPRSLEQAFLAEILRYLSRRRDHFPDSGAAMLEAGWMIEHGLALRPAGGRWLAEAAQALGELARCLHRVLWEADPACLDGMRAALAAGASYQDDFGALYRTIPTDLDYAFG